SRTLTANAPSVTAPVARFTATPTSGTVPLLVTFTDTSTGTVTGRHWDFGNHQTSTAPSAAITYNTVGSFIAKLTVSNAAGSSTASQTISTTAELPVANFSASPLSGPAPLAVTFTNASSGTVTDYTWNFGDGSQALTTQIQTHPSHTYAKAGTYPVSLTAKGPAASHTTTQTLTVLEATGSTRSPVAAYNFEEARGPIVVDASGQGHHGTIAGAKRTRHGQFGRALLFDGVDDWVTIPDADALDLSTGMTLQAWVYPTSNTAWRTILMKEQPGDFIYYLGANPSNQPVAIVGARGQPEAYDPTPMPLKKWRHLAATYDGQSLRLFVNGAQVATQAQTAALINSDGQITLGGDAVWGRFFKGRIDEVRLYRRALSEAEIKTDMKTAIATASPPKPLLGEQGLGAVSDALPQGTAAAFQTTASATGLVTSLPVYVDTGSASTRLIAGLYADSNGRPGARIATGTLSSPQAGSWNTILLPATAVTAGTKYWVAILSRSGLLKFRAQVGSTPQPSETSKSTALTSLPSTWRTGTVSANGPLSGYGAGY
ncbi:MAG: LamG-like jellyroll fold domain-containing protein, partial [Gammaproteobacteria bacterium]